MRKIKFAIFWIIIVFAVDCFMVYWTQIDILDYLQDQVYVYEGNSFLIRSHREIDDAALDEMGRSVTIGQEDEIDVGQVLLPQLKTPEYVPEGYQFESLVVTKYLSGRWEYVFTYRKETETGVIYIFFERTGMNKNL